MQQVELADIQKSLAALQKEVEMQGRNIQRLDHDLELMRSQALAGAVSIGEIKTELRQLRDLMQEAISKLPSNQNSSSHGNSILWDVVKIILTALFTLGLTAVWYVTTHPPT